MNLKQHHKGITALYVRVSTDAQAEEGYSIDFQTQALLNYCKAKGYENEKLYIDGGWSGSNLERPNIQALINDVQSKSISRVIVYKLDRLSRSQKDTLYLIEDIFLPNDVSFVSINESFDTATPFGRAMIGILSTFAQLERENIRERTRSGMLERVKEGFWPGGGHIPFGYDYDKDAGILIPNKDAETVRKIFQMYINGASTYKICHALQLKYERHAEQILQRKTYIGLITYLGHDYKGKHEPIISEETFHAAMHQMKLRSKQAVYSDSQYLFSGLLECGYCGAKIRYQKTKNGVKLYCYSREKSRPRLVKDPDCQSISYDAQQIERIILKRFFENELKLGNADYNVNDAAMQLIEELRRQKLLVEKKIIRLYSLYAEEGNELLIETIKKQQEELLELSKRLILEEEKTKGQRISKERLEEISRIGEVWDDLSFDGKRNVLLERVEKVVLKDAEIDINYHPLTEKKGDKINIEQSSR